MADVVTMINSSATLVKKLLTLPSIAKDAEAGMLIADLQLELAGVKTQLAELMDENRELRSQIKAKTEAVLVEHNGLYYDESGDGPFCTGCQDNNQKKIRLASVTAGVRRLGKYRCPVCTTHYL